MADAPLTLLPPVTRRRLAGTAGAAVGLAVVSVAASAGAAQAQEVTVEPGDTVSHIALRTSTSVAQIVAANGLDEAATIRAGQRLVIPTPGAPTPATPAATSHAVVAGDTVSALAARYGTTVRAIVDANGLDARALIRIGQTLTIPGAGASAAPASAPPAVGSHTVVAGDTVSGLAARYGTTVQAIVDANGLDSRALIRIGQTLAVPGAASTAAPTSGLVGDTFAGRTYPAATVASANQNKATLLATPVPTRDEMQQIVRDTAIAMGVDPALAQAISYQESGFNQRAVSPANAIGAMQVIPTSGEWASDLVGRPLDLLDPHDNAVAGVAILRQLVRSADDLPTAIAGYYQGLAGVREHGMYADTRRYVASVQTLMSRFS